MAAPTSFGEMLRSYRLAAGLTQEQLAERAGLSARAISDHERGIKQRPHLATVGMLAEALGMSPIERSLLTSAARKRGSSAGRSRQSQLRPPFPIGGFLGALPVGPLVAREAELARVVAVIDGLERGERPLTLLAGEPGIGKTRLAQEIGLVLQEREFLVLIGRCYRTEGDIPYYPFLEALGAAWAAVSDGTRAQISTHLPHLQRLVPEVGAPISGTSGTSQEERDRLRRAVAGLLQVLAAQAPVALLLDDLHWADRSSLGLLQHLIRFTRGSRIFLLGTYRDVEVGPDHPLQAAIADLLRDQLVEVVGLVPLSRTETRALIGATLEDVDVSEASTDLVHQRTGGNPFFVQAVLRELGGCIEQEGRGRRLVIDDVKVPNTVRALILQRLSSLSPAAQNLAFRASVLGQAFGFDDLLATGEDNEEEESLEEAKRVGLIRVTGRDSYAFSHALTHQAIYEELPAGRRRRLHLAAGRALECLPERIRRRRAGEIARHLLEGGNMERALVYTLLAGDQAGEVFAQAEAERFYRRAVDLARELDDRAREAEALEKLGGVLRFQGRYDEALRQLEQATGLYRVAGDPEGQGRSEAMIGMVHYARDAPRQGIARLDAISPSLEHRVSPLVRASLYEARVQCLFSAGEYAENLEATERYLEVARAAGDKGIVARAYGRYGLALALVGRSDEAIPAYEEALALADAAGDARALRYAPFDLAHLYERAGELGRARDLGRRYLASSERLGNPDDVALAYYGLALTDLLLGEWERVRAHLERAQSLSRTCTSSYATGWPLRGLGELCLLVGDWHTAERHLQAALTIARRSGDIQGIRGAQSLLARLDLRQGQPEAAIARLEPLLDRAGLREGQVVDLLPVLAEARLELAHHEVGLQQARATVIEALERASAQTDRVQLVWARRVQGKLLGRQGQWGPAEQAFGRATSLAHSMPYPYAEACALYEWGTMYAHRGDAVRARERLESALIIFRRLGACADIGPVEEALKALGPQGSSIQADLRW